MNCIFLKDDNGKIWLYYISDLYIREMGSNLFKPFWMTEEVVKSETSESEFQVQNEYLDSIAIPESTSNLMNENKIEK